MSDDTDATTTPPFDPARFNPHDPAFSRDPYPTYARFRAQAPVAKVEPYGSWWVFRHADVKAVLDDTEGFLKNNPLGGPAPTAPFDVLGNLPLGIFSMDPPRHTTLRALLEPMFADAIAGMDGYAAQHARALLAQVRGRQRFEFVQAFAAPLPPAVLFQMIGVPTATAGLSNWVDAIVAGHDITAPAAARGAAATCSMALIAYFQGLAAGCPMHGPKPPALFGAMQASTATTPPGMSGPEMQTSALNVVVAGYASTTYLLATGVYSLLTHPEQWARLLAEPSLVPAAVQEMLRHDAPAQLVDRYAAADTELAGVRIAKGDMVTAVLGSANRDAAVFSDPDRFDIDRDNAAQLGFGGGIHNCIGAPLVCLVAPAALTVLLQECPTLALAGTPQWQTDPYLRSVVNLPLKQ